MGGCCVAEKVGAIVRAEDWKFRRLAEAIRVLVFKLLVEVRAARGREWRNILQGLVGSRPKTYEKGVFKNLPKPEASRPLS